jgi:hypothetical protein
MPALASTLCVVNGAQQCDAACTDSVLSMESFCDGKWVTGRARHCGRIRDREWYDRRANRGYPALATLSARPLDAKRNGWTTLRLRLAARGR